jgi:hypothetical protein
MLLGIDDGLVGMVVVGVDNAEQQNQLEKNNVL